MSDAATLEYYQREAPRYTLSFGQAPSRHLDKFLDRLAPNARVLELGCGGGRDSAHFIERGFDLDATDGTPAMVAKANERFDVGARVMRFDELQAVADYNAVWAHACLLHVARSELPAILRAIHRALEPGGWHFANFKLGNAKHPDEGPDRMGRWTNLPSADWIADLYQHNGFRVIGSETYAGSGADGVLRDWIALTLFKSG